MEMKAKNEFNLDRLIPMVDYVLEYKFQRHLSMLKFTEKMMFNVHDYANFLKQKPELWMFIPCDENGNVLEEPQGYESYLIVGSSNVYKTSICKEYQQSKERIIFKGWEIEHLSKEITIIKSKENKMWFFYGGVIFKTMQDKKTEIESLEQLTQFNLELL